ncbi:hemolysin III family protein [Lipingzhangella sp. LS1_29]|uniref:Hemolysin III family protein n=1 Tax=Lipingzhangella rawalii TaxID=2055835 RepID=A0ABU2H7C8_9ACTN|nr:hemolysin III family protein [Lipingzhangella rawalii]MDS1271216.1 hemolysin III family protein [Lipingzhangella rawalii]
MSSTDTSPTRPPVADRPSGHHPHRPRLRGWLHLGTTPLAMAAGIVLIVLSPTPAARAASGIYAATAVLLFAVSAAYHLGRWSPVPHSLLRRLDHANIYLIIAGTYTPFLVLALSGPLRQWMLGTVWTAALIGVTFTVCWPSAPRWLSTICYLALGWIAVVFARDLVLATPTVVWILVLVGGVLYSLGAVTYASRWPDPHPGWFGFHEVFHALTVVAFVCQYVAVSFLVYTTAT